MIWHLLYIDNVCTQVTLQNPRKGVKLGLQVAHHWPNSEYSNKQMWSITRTPVASKGKDAQTESALHRHWSSFTNLDVLQSRIDRVFLRLSVRCDLVKERSKWSRKQLCFFRMWAQHAGGRSTILTWLNCLALSKSSSFLHLIQFFHTKFPLSKEKGKFTLEI